MPRPVTTKAYAEGLPITIYDDNKSHLICTIYNADYVKWSECKFKAVDSEGNEYEGLSGTETTTAYNYSIRRDTTLICSVQVLKSEGEHRTYAKIAPETIEELTITEVQFAY